ncbi:MAG: 2-C-methyl-D-erythritol 2,4-cyclodiphosphate synthase [Verrucomicrobiota bacterium]
MNRVGIGYDVHPLVKGRKLFLGGVEIPHDKGLEGHSDADALIHAIADALLGALGAGDIGMHFPNSDTQWKNMRSTFFLEKIAEMIRMRKGKIENIDASVIAEAPKLVPHVPAMKKALAEALMLTTDRINLKATTNEKMGFVGREEGIAAMAVACITLN